MTTLRPEDVAKQNPVPPRSWFPWLAFCFAAGALLVHNSLLQPWTEDDAYIYYRYAENWVRGNGVVFNAGVRVEGYTTILWVALLALGGALGIDFEFFSKVLGTGFALGSLVLVAQAHRFSEELEPRICAAAVLLLGSCGVFTIWTMGGMDAPMVAFFSVLTLLLHMRAMQLPDDRRRASLVGLCAGLATLARPECSVVVAAISMDRLCSDWRAGRLTLHCFVAGWAVVYLPYFAWRFAYYGHLLPNTFYAKVGGSVAQLARGMAYVGSFVWPGLSLVVPVLALLLFGEAAGRGRRATALFAAALGLHLAYVIGVGGDAMPAFRFFAIVMPIIALLAARGLFLLARSAERAWAVLLVSVLFNFGQSMYSATLHARVTQAPIAKRGKEVGLWMRERLPSNTRIAVNAAGAIPYFSGFETIDMLGLNDVHIAHREMPEMGRGMAGHEKGDGVYVLSQRPDIIILGPSWGGRKPFFVGDWEIWRHDAFKSQYVYEKYTLPSGNSVHLYRRRDTPKPAARRAGP